MNTSTTSNYSQAAEQIGDILEKSSNLLHIHPALHNTFTPLPALGTRLTQEQLHAVFDGDMKALRDLWRLSSNYQVKEHENDAKG